MKVDDSKVDVSEAHVFDNGMILVTITRGIYDNAFELDHYESIDLKIDEPVPEYSGTTYYLGDLQKYFKYPSGKYRYEMIQVWMNRQRKTLYWKRTKRKPISESTVPKVITEKFKSLQGS